ncbi:MAG: type II toxin-antitoxin system VapC family toxin [Holosporaceae bacterium]|jgi:PIN domain nuclease of toxin-antitoxin system|nr:type II toxin-antitoxin system VapC family toxin [Holosporaceae bacterium]
MTDILLDTHIFLWLMNGDSKLNTKNLEKIETTINSGFRVSLSAISVWEIGMLVAEERTTLTQPVDKWLNQAIKISSASIVEPSIDILLDSCSLPGQFHGDPADRMIVATSRIRRLPLVTQDEKIIAYIKSGFCLG